MSIVRYSSPGSPVADELASLWALRLDDLRERLSRFDGERDALAHVTILPPIDRRTVWGSKMGA
jgi:hypothetical protein